MSRRRPSAPPPAPPAFGGLLRLLVVVTCAAALGMLLWLARDILAQLRALGDAGGAASTRLLTGLFVVMCLAGFVAAALWAAVRKRPAKDGAPPRR
jgi:hypothetical protein